MAEKGSLDTKGFRWRVLESDSGQKIEISFWHWVEMLHSDLLPRLKHYFPLFSLIAMESNQELIKLGPSITGEETSIQDGWFMQSQATRWEE